MDSRKKINVVHTPDFREANPYQRLWVETIEGEYISSSFLNNYKKWFPFFRFLLKSKTKVDVIHLHWINPFVKTRNRFVFLVSTIRFLLDLVMVRSTGVKLVWTIHNHDVHDSKIGVKLFSILKFLILIIVNKVVVLNKKDVGSLISDFWMNKNNIFYIQHGNYKGVYNDKESTSLDNLITKSEDEFVYLFFGLIRPYKGVNRLLKTWSEFENKNKNVKLIVAGEFRDETLRSEIKTMVSSLNSVVLIDRFIKDCEVSKLFSNSDVVVLPFEKINNSGSLILALTCNKPTIAPLFPVVEEYLGQALDYCFDVDDEMGLLNSLNKVYTQKNNINFESIVNQNEKLNWSLLKPSILKMYLK